MKNLKALRAVIKADLIFTFKNPSSAVFGIVFPLVFILAFGFMGDGSASYDLVVHPDSDISNPIYESLDEMELVNLITDMDLTDAQTDLEKGKLEGIILIGEEELDFIIPVVPGVTLEVDPETLYTYTVDLTTSTANPNGGQAVLSVLGGLTDKFNLAASGGLDNPLIEMTSTETEGRKFSQIDFVLPGQLGFSLLNAGVFATAFLLVNLRETLVLKRFSATPVKKWVFILGLAISKLVYSMIQAIVIITVGHYFFDFTLINGITTVISMLFLSAIGLMTFLGFGLIVSGLAKDTTTIPPMAQLITLPQMLLSGTFFPIEFFPEWLQPISKALPLTYLNDAMRRVAFDGDPIWSLKRELLGLFITMAVVYTIAIRVFRYDEA